jgi:hypothetical protein
MADSLAGAKSYKVVGKEMIFPKIFIGWCLKNPSQ